MAAEISVTSLLGCVNGNVNEVDSDVAFTVDQAVQSGSSPGFVTVGTVEESETFGEITTLGWCKIKNLDATNYVDFGVTTTVYMIRAEAGETATFRFVPGVTLYMKANVAACMVEIRCYND